GGLDHRSPQQALPHLGSEQLGVVVPHRVAREVSEEVQQLALPQAVAEPAPGAALEVEHHAETVRQHVLLEGVVHLGRGDAQGGRGGDAHDFLSWGYRGRSGGLSGWQGRGEKPKRSVRDRTTGLLRGSTRGSY